MIVLLLAASLTGLQADPSEYYAGYQSCLAEQRQALGPQAFAQRVAAVCAAEARGLRAAIVSSQSAAGASAADAGRFADIELNRIRAEALAG